MRCHDPSVSDAGADQISTPDLHIRLMGLFEITAGDTVALPAGKATTILELLAVRRRSFVTVDSIVETLWGDEAPAGAAQNVASLVSRLRRVLGPERIAA